MQLVSRYTLGVFAALACAGCGGSQVGATAPALVAPPAHIYRSSRTKRQFLYLDEYKLVSGTQKFQTEIVSYPDGKEVGTLANYGQMCADSSGDAYIDNGSTVSEYAGGGESPIAQVALPSGVYGLGCAVDPTTGNIAVGGALAESSTLTGWLAVYPNLTESPTIYTSAFMVNFGFCAYDDKGNLFLDGYYDYEARISELPKGQSQFRLFYNSPPELNDFGPLQWDGKHMTLEGGYFTSGHSRKRRRGSAIYRLSLSGSSLGIVGTTDLDTPNGPDRAQFTWIQDNTVVKPYGNTKENDRIGVWHYPQGGPRPYKVLKRFEYIEYPLISITHSR
jgi:hypothetical protein